MGEKGEGFVNEGAVLKKTEKKMAFPCCSIGRGKKIMGGWHGIKTDYCSPYITNAKQSPNRTLMYGWGKVGWLLILNGLLMMMDFEERKLPLPH